MLNRMMFIYFIQKRGFLDSNTDYLSHRLHTVRRQHGWRQVRRLLPPLPP